MPEQNNADDHRILVNSAYLNPPRSDRGGNIGRKMLVPTDAANGIKKSADQLHFRGFSYSQGQFVNEVNKKVRPLVSDVPDTMNLGVLRLGADSGVTDIDTI